MPARPYWQGQIRLALVSIPVQLFSATRTGAEVRFRQIHAPSGKTISYQKSVAGIGEVAADEIRKGFEFEKGQFVLLEDDEIEAVRLESKRTLELTQFVDSDDIDIVYFEKPYYVVPADKLAEQAFVVLREALRQTGKVGLGQLTMRGREYFTSLKPCGRGMVLETLRYSDEVSRASGYFRDIDDDKPDAELLDLAVSLIARKTAPFDPSRFHDHYVEALRSLVARKLKAKGRKIATEPEPPLPSGSNVIDLMAALKKSIGSDDTPPRKRAAARAKPRNG
jgi:DNA end-binding protein Ku